MRPVIAHTGEKMKFKPLARAYEFIFRTSCLKLKIIGSPGKSERAVLAEVHTERKSESLHLTAALTRHPARACGRVDARRATAELWEVLQIACSDNVIRLLVSMSTK